MGNMLFGAFISGLKMRQVGKQRYNIIKQYLTGNFIKDYRLKKRSSDAVRKQLFMLESTNN